MGGFRDGGSYISYISDIERYRRRQHERFEREKKLKEALFLKNKKNILNQKDAIINDLKENKNIKFKVFSNEDKPYFLILSYDGYFIYIVNYYIIHNELKNTNFRINIKDSFFINNNQISFIKNNNKYKFYLEENINLLNEINKMITNNTFRF
tara:strand:+ start:349 stop:807 length:459 start_codon:yes stop_codon:yes gene_type:complete